MHRKAKPPEPPPTVEIQPVVTLTLTESHMLYNWLRDQWIPKANYGTYMQVMTKLGGS